MLWSAMVGAKINVATQLNFSNGKMLTLMAMDMLELCSTWFCQICEMFNLNFWYSVWIWKSVKKLSEQNTKPDVLKARARNKTKSVHAFCRTTWIVQGEVLKSALVSQLELTSLWDCCLTVVNDTEIKGRTIAAWQVMSAFDFLFGCCLGEFIFQ